MEITELVPGTKVFYDGKYGRDYGVVFESSLGKWYLYTVPHVDEEAAVEVSDYWENLLDFALRRWSS